MKRALVLCGGGSRGGYEIGAWQALRELGIRLDGVYGTSIGAMNASLVARGDVEAARTLWENITLRNITTIEDSEDFAIDRMVGNKRDVIPFLVENARRLRMDITPLEQLVREQCDEPRIRARGLQLGVMTFKAPQMQGCPMYLRDMKPGTLPDWVIASASCFPIFPAKHIDAQRYIDGGYCDNLPIDLALSDGMDEIIAIELHPYLTHPEYARMPWLTVVRPRHSLGGFLDFNPVLLSRNLRMGYQDAMKRFGRFDGWLYTFRPVSALTVAPAARAFMVQLTAFDRTFTDRAALHTGQPVNAPLLSALESETDFEPLNWKDVWLRGLELAATVMDFRVDAIYDAPTLLHQIRDYCAACPVPQGAEESALHAARKAGPRQTLALLTRWLDAFGDFPAPILRRLGEVPRETAAALFLHAATIP